MAEAGEKPKHKNWKRKIRGGSIMKSPSKLFDMMNKTSKEKLLSQKSSIDEGLVDPSQYLDLFAMATQVIGSKKDYYSEVKQMDPGSDIERRPPCNLGKENETKCRLDDASREELYKLLMRVVNSATLLEDRMIEGKMDGANASALFSAKDMHDTVQDILHAGVEEQKVWQARLAVSAKYQKILILTVHNADGLPSADADGFSDPYCKLGLVPREKSAVEKLSLKSIPDPDHLEKSRIQKKTLDPIWEETFELKMVEQPRILVMEVWDDDIATQHEQRASFKGLRGLKFKIIDFFRPGVDDFLGKRCIDLNTVPNEKTDHTFGLHGKSVKKKKGNIKISTEIIVRVEDGELEKLKSEGRGLSLLRDFLTEAARHQFVKDVDATKDHTMKELHSFIAAKIIQLLELDSYSQAVARVSPHSNYLISLSYERQELQDYLDKIIERWDVDSTKLREEDLKRFIDNIEHIYSHEVDLLKQSRILFPPNSTTALAILKQIVHLIVTTFNFLKRIDRLASDMELISELRPKMKEDIHSWYEVMHANSQPLQMTTSGNSDTQTERVTTLTNLCSEVAQDLIAVSQLYPQAYEESGLSYFDVSYQILDDILSEEVSRLLSSASFKKYFEQISIEDKKMTDESKIKQFTFAILILKLYQHVKDICQFKEHLFSDQLKEERYKMEEYQAWFKPCVLSWLDVARNLSIGTVKRAIEIDTKDIIKEKSLKVTSSAIDITICFEQCYQFHSQLSWSHEQDGALVVAKIVKIICDIGKFYSKEMHKLLTADLDKLNKKNAAVLDINETMCAGFNNIQVVLEYMAEIPDRLKWQELVEQSEENKTTVEDWRRILDSSMEFVQKTKTQMLNEIIAAFSKQFRVYFNEFMKKPVDLSVDDAIDGLMTWMANNLEGAWTTMLTDDFSLMLNSKWIEIVKICSELQKSKSKQISYCTRMNVAVGMLYNFLHVDGSGLSQTEMETESYLMLKSALSLYGDNTEDLIAIYCSQLCEANQSAEMKYGSLTFSGYYVEDENVINFELIRGEKLPKMDIIGSCDPYIKLKTLPKELFEKVETKHQNNTQNPKWNLKYSFKLSENLKAVKGATLQMSLYDYDRFNKNDYGGSVYFSLDELPRSSEEASETTLNIMFPVQTQILSAISDRTDKEATKFAKKIKKYIDEESEMSAAVKEKGKEKKSKKKDKKKN